MATFGEAVDLILTELNRSDTSITVVVEREYRKAVEFYAPTRFWFNQSRTSFTASNTIYYTFSTVTALANMLEIDQVLTTVNSGVIELQRASAAELNYKDVSGFTGYPAYYAIFGEKMRLYPTPASGTTYQIDVEGTVRLGTLSASGDSNAWTNAALDLIAARVEKQLCAKRFKDLEAAGTYAEAESIELQKLLDRTERYLSTGRLKGSGW